MHSWTWEMHGQVPALHEPKTGVDSWMLIVDSMSLNKFAEFMMIHPLGEQAGLTPNPQFQAINYQLKTIN